jgi:hypothetical protein
MFALSLPGALVRRGFVEHLGFRDAWHAIAVRERHTADHERGDQQRGNQPRNLRGAGAERGDCDCDAEQDQHHCAEGREPES